MLRHLQALHQQELVQGGHIGGTQLIALDDAWQRSDGNLLEGVGLGEAFLNEFSDFFVKLLAVPLADVGWCFFDGIVAVSPAGVAVAVALINERFQVIEQRPDVGLFLLVDGCLDARDDVGHVVLRDAALGNAVAHQGVNGQFAVAALERLVQVGQRRFGDVLGEIEVNFLLTAR